MNSVSPILQQIEKHAKRLDSNGSACTYDILKQNSVDNVKIDDAWKGDNPNMVMSADSPAPLSQILADLLNTSDLVVLEVVGMCDEYKTQALRVKCSLSTKKWRVFCVSQLSRNVGARVLHRYANRQNAPSPVPLFKPGALHKTPNNAVDADAAHWAGFWQKPRGQRDAHEVLEKMRNACKAGLRVDSSCDKFDTPPHHF